MKNSSLIAFAIYIILIAACKDNMTECPEYECLNGSICFNGTCACLEGFTGSNCDQIILQPFELVEVKVNRFPALKSSGEEWDGPFNVQPDIYIRISWYHQPVYTYLDNYSEADHNEDYIFEIENDSTLVLLQNDNYQIELYDRDIGSDDLMGSAFLSASDFPNEDLNEPQFITLSGNKVDFEIIIK